MVRVEVLRWGHRFRDKRLTSHVALTAYAMGASGLILSDVKDESVKRTIQDTVRLWGEHFHFEMGVPWRQIIDRWHREGGIVVHLSAYGENIVSTNVLQRIRSTGKDILLLVGSQKVPRMFFSEQISDFNVAVGNIHHSELSSVAIFLFMFFGPDILRRTFPKAKFQIVSHEKGKRVRRIGGPYG